MEYKIITSEYFNPVSWSGGIATELFIFPYTADYQRRNFQFRLSTATIETDKSDFTVLKGVSRKLMVLAGKITLSHEDHYSRQLNKFDVDEFEGEWKTSSAGKCTDFNLMTSGKTTGELTAIVVEKKLKVNYINKGHYDWIFVYVFSGKVRVDINSEITTVNKGDLLVLYKQQLENFEGIAVENSELVFCEVILK